MKKCVLFTIVIALLLSLAACANENRVERSGPISAGDQNGTITFDEGTWSAGTVAMDNGTYVFSYDMNGTVTVIYPDGYVYTQTEKNGGYASPVDYDADAVKAKGYIDGFTLIWAIESATAELNQVKTSGGPSPLLAIVLILLGAWYCFLPKLAWQISHGWKYKNAEPSQTALSLYRISGAVAIAVGVVCAVAAF